MVGRFAHSVNGEFATPAPPEQVRNHAPYFGTCYTSPVPGATIGGEPGYWEKTVDHKIPSLSFGKVPEGRKGLPLWAGLKEAQP